MVNLAAPEEDDQVPEDAPAEDDRVAEYDPAVVVDPVAVGPEVVGPAVAVDPVELFSLVAKADLAITPEVLVETNVPSTEGNCDHRGALVRCYCRGNRRGNTIGYLAYCSFRTLITGSHSSSLGCSSRYRANDFDPRLLL